MGPFAAALLGGVPGAGEGGYEQQPASALVRCREGRVSASCPGARPLSSGARLAGRLSEPSPHTPRSLRPRLAARPGRAAACGLARRPPRRDSRPRGGRPVAPPLLLFHRPAPRGRRPTVAQQPSGAARARLSLVLRRARAAACRSLATRPPGRRGGVALSACPGAMAAATLALACRRLADGLPLTDGTGLRAAERTTDIARHRPGRRHQAVVMLSPPTGGWAAPSGRRPSEARPPAVSGPTRPAALVFDDRIRSLPGHVRAG